MIGTSLAASLGAVLTARVHSHRAVKKYNAQLNEAQTNVIQAKNAWNSAMGRSVTAISASQKPVFHKLEEAFKKFNEAAEARAKANVSPIRADSLEVLNITLPRMISTMRDSLSSSHMNEKKINAVVKMHGILIELLNSNGFFVDKNVKELNAGLRKANLVSQGQMDKSYIEAICPAMEYSTLEILKTLLRGSERATTEELMKMKDQLHKHATNVQKWAEKRITF